jgi:1,4-dihydroxy-2-naphthoate octaprenyltransferase
VTDQNALLDAKISAVLDDAERLFLSTAVDGNSSGASVFFARDGDDLVFFTFHPSRKAEQIRVNPRVAAVVWPRGQEGIRGLQIEGLCSVMTDAADIARAREKILAVTDAFQGFMDDEFLQRNKVVGYYRLRPTLVKHVDFHAERQFEFREYPQNRPAPLGEMLATIARRAQLWLRAVRAPFFTATVVPVLLGAVIAWGDLKAIGAEVNWSWAIFLLALAGGMMAQAGTNLANDYGDHNSRADEWNKVPSPFNGGSRIIQAGLMAPWKVLLAALLMFAGTIAIGLSLNKSIGGSAFADTPLLWFGLAGTALGLLYTLTPLRLAYTGFGEVAIFLGFGPVTVLGTHYVLTAGHQPEWTWQQPLLASIPVAIFVMLIVWINQFQDAPSDDAAGKRNWVVRTAEHDGSNWRFERPFRWYVFLNGFGFGFIAALGLASLVIPAVGTPLALLALIPALLTYRAIGWGREWLANWNQPDADRRRLPYELLRVNVATIAVHFSAGMLLVLAYWAQGWLAPAL